MSRQLNPSQIWSQVPVANRLIEVNTKTGFSLTAGSYSVRASSIQRGTLRGQNANENATISAVTLVRAHETYGGTEMEAGSASFAESNPYATLTTTTNLSIHKAGGTAFTTTAWVVSEWF